MMKSGDTPLSLLFSLPVVLRASKTRIWGLFRPAAWVLDNTDLCLFALFLLVWGAFLVQCTDGIWPSVLSSGPPAQV